jgi:predicted protein tyrosine phosphatase
MNSEAPPFGITVCGIGELDGHSATGASHVLSILDPDRPVPEAFGAFGEHEKLELRLHDIIEDTPGHIAKPAVRTRCHAASAGALPCRHFALHRGDGADPRPGDAGPFGRADHPDGA